MSERAQAGLERERRAYWIRKAAAKVRRQEPRRPVGLTPIPAKPQYPTTSGNQIWSQMKRPARPSDMLVRAERQRQLKLLARAQKLRSVTE
jgi:hypothetical protein